MEPETIFAKPEETPSTNSTRRGQLWRPMAIVFLSNACMMILELVAGRIIAPYVGVSLYTWTSVIGVVLAGVGLGSFLGGRLADRWASLHLLGFIFLAAGLFSTGILAVEKVSFSLPYAWPYAARILALTAALFFLPSMVLGGVTPVVYKLAVLDLSRTGSTTGRISAAGTLGSIAGTFATGFVLISWLGTHLIVWGVAVLLVLLALIFLFYDTFRNHKAGGQRAALVVVFAALLATTAWAWRSGWLRGSCDLETNYYCIRILKWQEGNSQVRLMLLDNVSHSQNSIGNPKELAFGYEQIYAELSAYRAAQVALPQTLFLGGGGYTFPRYMQAVYPGSKLDVVEIDPGVTQIAYQQMGVTPGADLTTYNEDARTFLARPLTTRYDLIFADAFNNYSVPYHLVTREFDQRVQAWLADEGIFMANLIDSSQRDFLRAYVATLSLTFPHVYIVPAAEPWREMPHNNYVVVATNRPLDLLAFEQIDGGDGETTFFNQVLNPEETAALLAEGRSVILTDQFAPVDQLLASFFRGFTSGQ